MGIPLRALLALAGLVVAVLGLSLLPVPDAPPLRLPWAEGRSLHARLSLGGCLFCSASLMLALAAWPDIRSGYARGD